MEPAAGRGPSPGETSCEVLVMSGDLDLISAPELGAALRRAGAHPGSQVLVDLQAVTFMDCAGLRPLLQAQDRLGVRLLLRNPSPAVTLLLQLTKLLDTFRIVTDPASPTPRVAAPRHRPHPHPRVVIEGHTS